VSVEPLTVDLDGGVLADSRERARPGRRPEHMLVAGGADAGRLELPSRLIDTWQRRSTGASRNDG
jgi:hypothetical protein